MNVGVFQNFHAAIVHIYWQPLNESTCITLYVFQYLGQLQCPYKSDDLTAVIDWLLGYAVRLEYGDSGKCQGDFYTHIRFYDSLSNVSVVNNQ